MLNNKEISALESRN